MIRHIVLLRFRPEVTADQRNVIYTDLAALKSVVPGFLAMSYGPNVSPEGKNKGFSDGFTMDFVDEAARDAYLEHPDHKAAGARMVAAREGERDGLVVFDLVV